MPVSLQHAAALAQLVDANHAHLKAFLPKVATLATLEAAKAHLEHAIDGASEGELYEWHIFHSEQLCGAIRVNQIERINRKASIAYYLAESHQGEGVATSSVRAVMGYCFRHLNLNRMELRCAAENLPSQRMAKRLGFTWEGMLRQSELLDGVFVDHFIYSLLRQDAGALVQSP